MPVYDVIDRFVVGVGEKDRLETRTYLTTFQSLSEADEFYKLAMGWKWVESCAVKERFEGPPGGGRRLKWFQRPFPVPMGFVGSQSETVFEGVDELPPI